MDITRERALDEVHPEELGKSLDMGGKADDEWADHNKLLTHRAVQKEYSQIEWYQELNRLGQHWHASPSDGDPVWLAQFSQAYGFTYAALWSNGAALFAHRSDADAIVDKAMEYLVAAIKSYDPKRSSLGARISSLIEPRIKDALAFCTISRDHSGWADELTQLQYLFPADPSKRGEWISRVIRKTFHFYTKRIDRIASKPEVRAAVREQLRDMLLCFDPDTQTLHSLVEQWVNDALRGDHTDVTLSSLDTPVGEDGDITVGELIPDQHNDPGDIVESQNTFSIILAALVTNFQIHIGKGSLKKKVLYSRLNYTEQLSYFAQALPLPDAHRQDILKPLESDYFRYFMAVDPATELTLRVIERSRIRPVIGFDPFLLEDERWNDQGFLPAKAQKGYLHTTGISTSDATISEQRKSYREGFLQILEGMR